MNSWAVRNFFKKQAVIAVIHYPNHRVREFWVLPNKDDRNTITIENDSTRYSIDTETEYFSLRSGIPVFTYKHNEHKPINLLKNTHSTTKADEIEAMANNKIVKEINRAVAKKGNTDWAFIGVVVMVVGFAIMLYYMNT